MSQDYTPVYSAASERAYSGRVVTDPLSYTTYDSKVVSAKYIGYELINEILALWRGAVAAKEYQQTYTCIAGLNVGDPVYISANNTATLALATTDATAKVFGFCAYKPTTTTCYIDHFRYKSGLSGLTANSEVFLTNAGAFSASAGTVRKVVGVALSATEALLCADAISGQLSPPFVDTQPLIKGSADATKLMRFEVDGFTTATTRVITPPDSNFTMAGINIAQTFTANQTISNSSGYGGLYINDSVAGQPTINFDISGVSKSYIYHTTTGPYLTIRAEVAGSGLDFWTAGATRWKVDPVGNWLGGGTAVGTNGVYNIGLASGTAPTTSPADYAAMWVADLSAGNAGWHMRTEAGNTFRFGALTVDGNYAACYAQVATPDANNFTWMTNGTNLYFNAPASSGTAGLYVANTGPYLVVNAKGVTVGATAPATGTNILKIESGTAWTSVADAVALRSADSAATNANLWAQNEAGIVKQITGLDKRRTNTQTVTDSTTLAADDTLVVNVVAGEKYEFRLTYIFTTVNTSGVSVDLGGGTCSFTSFSATGEIKSLSLNTFLTAIEMTAATTLVGFTATGTVASVQIRGAFVANAAGTFAPRFAQNAETGAAESVIAKANSTLILEHIGA